MNFRSPAHKYRPDISNRNIMLMLAAIIIAAAIILLWKDLPAPGSPSGQLAAALGATLLFAPLCFSMMKRSGLSASPPSWFVAHVISSLLGGGLIFIHVASGKWFAPPGLILLLLVFLTPVFLFSAGEKTGVSPSTMTVVPAEPIYDQTQAYVTRTVDGAVKWFDNFFVPPREELEAAYSFLRFINEFRFIEKDGFSYKPKVKLKVNLPGVERRTALIIGADDEDELAGVAAPEFAHGVSLGPILHDVAAPGHAAVSYSGKARTIRTKDHRLIVHKGGEVELYDHASPEKETRNVAKDQPQVVDAMRNQLEEELRN